MGGGARTRRGNLAGRDVEVEDGGRAGAAKLLESPDSQLGCVAGRGDKKVRVILGA